MRLTVAALPADKLNMNDSTATAKKAEEPAKPKVKAPPLVTVNGFGFRLRSARNLQNDSGVYEATLYFTIFFIPVFALKAYQVLDAPNGGWHFLDRADLSDKDRMWNRLVGPLVIAAFAGLIYWAESAKL